MKIQGEDGASAGHAGLMDMMNDIFAPGKEHTTEQKQYDERVGRRPVGNSGGPLDFNGNSIALVVPPEGAPEQAEPAANDTQSTTKATGGQRRHRQAKSK